MPSRAFAGGQGATGQYLISSAPFNNSMTTYTLTAWVYPTAIPSFSLGLYLPVLWKGTIFSDVVDFLGPQMSIYSDVNGNLQLWCEQSYATTNASVFTQLTGELPLNAWSLISFVVGGKFAGSAQGFVNGVEVVYDPISTDASGTVFDDSAFPWTVGLDNSTPQPGDPNPVFYVGYISDTRIYTRALSSAELLQLASFTNPSSTGLSAEWKMCGNSPEVDSVGGHNLTVHLAGVSNNQPHAFCPSSAYSVPDDRNYASFPNNAQNVQGTFHYTSPAHPSTNPPVDSRTTVPTDSRVASIIPQNSRTPGTFGPGE